jgi:hypothetical protein
LTHQPDAIVIYSGHNEFLESRSYADVLALPEQQQWVARFASNFRTVREVRRWLASDDARGKVDFRTQLPSEVDARLDHSGGLEQYHRDATWRHGVEQHFADTLRRMVVACQSADVPIVLCSPASDLVSTSPFKIENSPILDSKSQFEFEAAWAKATQVDSNLSKAERAAACNAPNMRALITCSVFGLSKKESPTQHGNI